MIGCSLHWIVNRQGGCSFVAGSGYRVHGPVQPPDPRVRHRAPGEDHGRVPGPVPVVRGGQAPSVPALDQAHRLGATAPARLQVVPRCVSSSFHIHSTGKGW